jgi:hypothetical protein
VTLRRAFILSALVVVLLVLVSFGVSFLGAERKLLDVKPATPRPPGQSSGPR